MGSAATFGIFHSALNQYSDEITNVAERFVEKAANEPNGRELPLTVEISIDYNVWSTVLEWKLALKTLLDEPLQSKRDMEMCVWLMMFSVFCDRYPQLKISPQLDQVHCIIRFSNLPTNDQYEFVPFRHPVRLGLSVMRCILSSFGDCCQLLRQTIWCCSKQCASKNLVVNVEYSIASNDKRVNKCSICDEFLKENEVCNCWNWRFNEWEIKGLCFYSIGVIHIRDDGFKFSKLQTLKHLHGAEEYVEMSESSCQMIFVMSRWFLAASIWWLALLIFSHKRTSPGIFNPSKSERFEFFIETNSFFCLKNV